MVGRHSHERGAAMILVVVVIAALIAVAAPFVVSMRLHEKSSRGFAAQLRAKHLADAGRSAALAHLMKSHPDEERRNRVADGDTASDPEGIDTHDEVQRFELPSIAGMHTLESKSATGALLDLAIKDARARIDINTAGPHALANLLGTTVTTQVVSYREEKRIFLEDVSPFLAKDDNDPQTIDGFIRLNGEYIAYRSINRHKKTLENLTRGYFFSRGYGKPPDDPERRKAYHPAGSLVQDGRGYKIAWDPFWRYMGTDREGFLARFDSPAAIRRTADWEFGTLRAALVLSYGYGVTPKKLRAWGITDRAVGEAGLQRGYLDREKVDRSTETPEQKKKRLQAERALKGWGIPVDPIRFLKGDKGVIRLYERLKDLDGNVRDKLAARWKQRNEAKKTALGKISKWLKVETKRQMGALTELRNKAPFLETIGRVELEERLRPYITTDAPPEGEEWSDPLVVSHKVQFNPYGMTTRLHVQDTRRFKRWRMVRIQPRPGAKNQRPEYRMCWRVNQARSWVLLFPQLDWDYEANEIEISARQPRPVNVNTASRWVLQSLLTGLMSRTGQKPRAKGGSAPNFVTPREAAAVADALVKNGNITDPTALRAVLLELRAKDSIDDHDVDAILRNAVDPSDPMLRIASLPFAYTSGDVYEVRATGIINNPAGIELARHTYHEVVRVAPPRDLVWHIDSQADFSDRIYVNGRNRRRRDGRLGFPDSAAFLFLPGRWSNHVQTRPSYIGPYSAVPFAFPSRSHAPGQGDLLPLLSREPDLGRAGTVAQAGPQTGPLAPYNPQRWDGQLEGVNISQLTLSANNTPTRWFTTESGTPRSVLGPGHLRGWFRFDSIPGADQKAFVFDSGDGDTRNRFSLYLHGPGRLVFEAWDEALDTTEGTASPNGGPRPSAQVIYDRPQGKPFQRGSWYHLAVWFKGADRGDLALAVDGQFVGQQTFGSKLTQALDAWGTTLTVADASQFPNSGWVRVGGSRFINSPNAADRGIWNTGYDANNKCEVLHYSAKNGNTLVLDQTKATRTASLPANATNLRIRDLDDRTRQVGSVPTNARRPRRGSGHLYQYRFQVPRQNGRGMNTRFRHEYLGYRHEAGTLVVPYGYHSWVKNEPAAASSTGPQSTQSRIRRGGAVLRQPLPRNTPYTLAYAPLPYDPNNPYPQVVAATDTEIPVFWLEPYVSERPTTVQDRSQPPNPDFVPTLKGGFPPFGILRIGGERVFYGGVDLRAGKFINCIRGIEGTTAAAHVMFTPVVLESIQVSNFTDYPRRNALTEPRRYLSLSWRPATAAGDETEWLAYQNCQTPNFANRGLVLVPPRDDFNPLSRFRFRSVLNDMRRQGTLVGVNPGQRLMVAPVPVPNPIPPGYQPPQIQPYIGWPWKEVLKREEPSVIRPARITMNIPGRRRPVTFNLPNPPFELGSRACKQTVKPPPLTGHIANTKIVPTFFLRIADGYMRGGFLTIDPAAECGSGDIVTVMDDATGASPPRQEMRVAHAALGINFNTPPGGQGALRNLFQRLRGMMTQILGTSRPPGDAATGWIVAFDDFVRREYQGARNARIAKWPTGNFHTMPNLVFGRARSPSGTGDTVADAPGTLQGKVDDVVVMQLNENITGRDPLLLANSLQQGFASGSTSAGPVRGRPRTWQQGRIYLADGEVIGVVNASGGGRGMSNLTLTRGALGTTAQVGAVSKQTALWRLTWPAHCVASGGYGGSRGQLIPVRPFDQRTVRFRQGFDGGYLRTPRNGVIPYVGWRRSGRGSYFYRPVDRFGRGVYTGAFGTNPDGRSPARPAANDLLVDMPFRHHDRYQDGVLAKDANLMKSSLQGVFFSASKELSGALVKKVEWDEHLPDPACEVKVAVRLDGAPAWDGYPAQRAGQKGRLYLFDDPKAKNEIMLRANRVEIRVYLTFKRGAFQSDAWKDGPLVGAVRIHYRQPTRILRREERTE